MTKSLDVFRYSKLSYEIRQEEAIRLATVKQSPLVTVLLIGSGKSLIFIVLAILVGIGVIIVVALYTELKR
ncbi:hypothetical protein LB507_011522 [Fusarium sp. FIESC RH6]|nr:hypothetical protein LB507_011522 [Fusarium sp. FIESC RH6]